MKKIMFVTGTRADYGKMKPLMLATENSDKFEAHIYISGMHLIESLGNTYTEVLKDKYKNVHIAYGAYNTTSMSHNLGSLICNMTGYIERIKPDLIVVHGDRVDALAGATTGALNNIRVAHVEGGEVSGTIDESIRHAISKFAHWHFVANEEARQRLIQLGENNDYIFTIGSPDIDIMLSDNLPSLEEAKKRYDIKFDKYAILMYHPVTTEFEKTSYKIKELLKAIENSNKNYIVIYPNNDLGSEIIISEYEQIKNKDNIRVFPSIRFEFFLTLLKNSEFLIGNSSAGIRETGVYGIPSIDIGTRQSGRYSSESGHITHTSDKSEDILFAINNLNNNLTPDTTFGVGDSVNKFIKVLENDEIFSSEIQKRFIDINF